MKHTNKSFSLFIILHLQSAKAKGQLTGKLEWLECYDMLFILIIGNTVTASAIKEEADALASKYPGVEPVFMNILERPDHLKELILSADTVISLLPYTLHHHVAECCISTKTHMVTASYCSPEMKELHQRYISS